jgi:cellulose synthase/poly-beta-1,6-N-acetylglucosamine synthase-like glycosyltransferase
MAVDLEIPIGKKTLKYRLFEMLPATISYGAFILLVVLSLISPVLASVYLILIIVTLFVKAIGIAIRTIQGHKWMEEAQKVNWHQRLLDISNPKEALGYINEDDRSFGYVQHRKNLEILASDQDKFPNPSEIYNAVIIATYNEAYEVLEPTVRSVMNSTFDNDKIILTIAYEQRGGEAIKNTVLRLQKEFKDKFFDFIIVEHPTDLPNEVIGKGGNITFAGHYLQKWLVEKNIKSKNVIVTTLDSDNRPYPSYFDYVTYEFIVREDRKHLSYQPVSLFLNNIWDAPAPMRVIAAGNSFWNIISSMRPHTLRNFASHSQPMDALEEMSFWSTRTIVEDGHQYWRSYFHFKGDYSVLPIHVPIYQDAVLSDTLLKTLKAQFIQLRRWSYGASDVPYVASLVLSKKRTAPLLGSLARLLRLIDGHVSLASVSILVAVGAWVPLLVNGESARSIAAHQLPDVVSVIQRIALLGLFVTIFASLKMLPPRPERYKKHRTIFMVTQWVLMPLTSIAYGALAALNAQGRLFIGKYLDKFDVTDKATYQSIAKSKK